MRNNKLVIIAGCLLLAACSSSRYKFSDDHAPTAIPNLDHIADAVPIAQPHSRYANKDYTVRGKRYEVWRDIEELTQKGQASWYGKKFHGHKTSNGEVYDMFSMSAAHKNLPLPSFVKVTNLVNQKTVVVRVNDRGPFHPGRIIDLSYAAAYKLDMLKSGTTDVEIELIVPDQTEQMLLSPQQQYFIQVLASSDHEKVKSIADGLSEQYEVAHRLKKSKKFYRLQVGPIDNNDKAQLFLADIQQKYQNAYVFEELITTPQTHK